MVEQVSNPDDDLSTNLWCRFSVCSLALSSKLAQSDSQFEIFGPRVYMLRKCLGYTLEILWRKPGFKCTLHMGVNCSHFPFSFLPREKVNLTANVDQLYGNCWPWELGIILEMPSIYTDLPSKRTRWECGSWAGVCDWVQMGVTQWELIGPRAPTIVRAAPSSSTGSSIWSWIDCPPCWLATIVAGLPPLGLPGCPPWWYGVVGGQWCHHRLGFQLNQEAIRQSAAWQPEDLNQLTFDIINNALNIWH